VPDDQITMPSCVLDEETIGVVSAGDHTGEVATGDGRGHRGFIMGRHSSRGIHRDPNLLQQSGVRVIAGHRQYRVGRQEV
jgi:hypothetical protein